MAKPSKRQSAEGIHEAEKIRKVKKVKSNKRVFIREDSDLEEDPALSESQRLLATSKKTSKMTAMQSDAHLARFRVEVEQSQQELGKLVQVKTADVLQQDARAETIYLSTVMFSLSHPVLRDLEPSNLHSKSTTALHPLRQMAESLVGSAKRLLHIYDAFCQEALSPKGFIKMGNEWDEDWGRLNSLFDKQRKVTKNRVISCLQDRRTAMKPKSAEDTARENNIWINFAGSRIEHDEKDESWAMAVRRVQRGVTHLTKHLQDEQ